MSNQIKGNITTGNNTSLIRPEELSLTIYNEIDGSKEVISGTSSTVSGSNRYAINYNSNNIVKNTGKYFVELEYAGFHFIREVTYPELESGLNNLDWDLSAMDFTIEVRGRILTSRGVPFDEKVWIGYIRVTLESETEQQQGAWVNSDKKDGFFSFKINEPFAPYMMYIQNGMDAASLPGIDIRLYEYHPTAIPENNYKYYSPVFYNIKQQLECDIVTQHKSYGKITSFEKMNNILGTVSLLGSRIEATMSSYVATKLGISEENAEKIIVCNNLSIDLGYGNKEVLFALLAKDNVKNYTDLLYKTDEEITHNLYHAIDNNLINMTKEAAAEEVILLKKAFLTDYLRSEKNQNSYFNVKCNFAHIATAPADNIETSKRAKIISCTAQWNSSPDSGSLKELFIKEGAMSETEYEKYILFDDLFAVSGNNLAVTQAITANSRDTVKKIIAQRNSINISSGMIPAGADINEYKWHVEKNLEKTYPSEYLVQKFKEDTQPALSDIRIFLNNNPNFKFGQNHGRISVHTLNTTGISDKDKLGSDLQKIEQLYQITPEGNKSEWINFLLDNGISSAHQISNIPLQNLEKLVEEKIASDSSTHIGKEDAAYIHKFSVYLEDLSMEVFARWVNPHIATNVVPGYTDLPKEKIEGLPTLNDLFGNQDYFSYPENRNMLSPAAYLMDLLEYVRSTENDVLSISAQNNGLSEKIEFPANTKVGALFQRRPDIQRTLLNCGNTENVMPHIDLVIEILERAVYETELEKLTSSDTNQLNLEFDNWKKGMQAIGIDPDQETEDNWKKQWKETLIARRKKEFYESLDANQSTWSTDELAAFPENTAADYINGENGVYKKLRDAGFPWNLPFFFWLEEYRIYLKQLSLSREQMLRAFNTESTIDDTLSPSLEYLGLNSKEAEIITTKVGKYSGDYFKVFFKTIQGEDGKYVVVPRGRVSELMTATGLTFDEIKEVMNSYFVNPEFQLPKKDGDAPKEDDPWVRFVLYTKPGEVVPGQGIGSDREQPGTLEATYIQTDILERDPKVPDMVFYDRMHRFIRLQRALNISVHELDLILHYLGMSWEVDFNENPSDSENPKNHLNDIASILKIKEQLNLKLEETLLLVNDFRFENYPGYVNLYDYIFLRRTEKYELKEELVKLRNDENVSITTTYTKAGLILPYISGIKITEEQYRTIIQNEFKPNSDIKITIEGLSAIFRVAYLCKSLNITEESYYFLRDYLLAPPEDATQPPINLRDPQQLLEFIQKVHKIHSYGFTIPDLSFLINGSNLKGNTLYMGTEGITQHLKKLQTDLKSLIVEDSFYQEHVVKNVSGYFETSIKEAVSYIFENFGTGGETSSREVVSGFINKHYELFGILMLFYPELKNTFLDNATDTDRKMKLILSSLGVEIFEDPYAPVTEEEKTVVQSYSQEKITDIFRKIKSRILLEIINENYSVTKSGDKYIEVIETLEVVIEDRNLTTKSAYAAKADFNLPSVASKNEPLEAERNVFSSQSINHDLGKSKYTQLVRNKTAQVIFILVPDFIKNNSEAFPANTTFLIPSTGNSEYLTGKMDRYKKFVIEKEISVYNQKMADLRKLLSEYFTDADFEEALKFIITPEQAFENKTSKEVRNFLTEGFGKFMPVPEIMDKLYTRPDENEDNASKSRNVYLENYCDRIDFVLDYLKQNERIDAVIKNFTDFCGITEVYIRKFLFDYWTFDNSAGQSLEAIYAFLDREFINSEIITRESFAIQMRFCNFMYRVAQFVKTFKISPEILDDIFAALYEDETISTKFNLLRFMDLTDVLPQGITNYLNFADAVRFSNHYFTDGNNFFKFFRQNSSVAYLPAQAKEYMAKITGCTVKDIDRLNKEILPKNSYVSWFKKLLECTHIMQYLGVSAETAISMNKADREINDADTANLRQTVKNKYTEAEWNKIAAELRNPLRIKQRDALRDYLLVQNDNFKNSNDLFNYYLIDTEMSTCAKTNRIIQATLAVQLFIQRVLMGMESVWETEEWNGVEGIEIPVRMKLSFTKEQQEQLVWRRNYRVWEANRKILFFPENWLEPELRYDKTPMFKEIEERLQQNDIDETVVSAIYFDYIEHLEEISNMEILAAHRPYILDPEAEVKHIEFVGRTKGQPHKYYHRRLDGAGLWTPWQEINNGMKGDVVKLVVWKETLYMFWPELSVTNKIEEGMEYAYATNEIQMSKDNDKPTKWTAVRMAWSRYKNGKWTKATYCEDTYVEPCNGGNLTNVLLTGEAYPHDIRVDVRFNYSGNIYWRAKFVFDGNRLRLEYNADNGLGNTIQKQGCSLTAEFGDKDTFYNKALCNSDKAYYKLTYTNDGKLELFKQQTLEKYPLRYTILNDATNYHNEASQLKADAITSYFKPLILEDRLSNKTFLGIPYKPDDTKGILGGEILNLKYKFINFYHPLMPDMKDQMKGGDYSRLFDADFHDTKGSEKLIWTIQNKDNTQSELLFKDYYLAGNAISHYPQYKEISFGEIRQDNNKEMNIEDPFAVYNWELFYHIPMLIADNLSRNMKFEEAQKWYHLIFDPTIGGNEAAPKKYWKIKPFRDMFDDEGQLKGPANLQSFAKMVNADGRYKELVDKWQQNPFNAHLVAKEHMLAYMRYVTMKYIENLIAWADMYFTKDTMEDINQASLLYILAADLLGIKPQKIDGSLSEDRSYIDLASKDPDPLSNVYLQIQGILTVMAKHNRFRYFVRNEYYNTYSTQSTAFHSDFMGGSSFINDNPAPNPGTSSGLLRALSQPNHSNSYVVPVSHSVEYHEAYLNQTNYLSPVNEGFQMQVPHTATARTLSCGGTVLYSVSYFGTPHNDKMEQHWDTVADRLFKIRHCMNIQGVVRELPLTAPPIDPGAIAAAMASGADLSTALSTLTAPLPLYRFSYMLQKAMEFTNDVKSFGSNLLSVLEKSDAEAMSLLRATHEKTITNSMTLIREKAIEEAIRNIEALENSKVNVIARRNYYKNKKSISDLERKAMDLHSKADELNEQAADLNAIAGVLGLIPQAVISFPPAAEFGGIHLAQINTALASVQSARALKKQNAARETDTKASYERRFEDWAFQGEQAAGELVQIDKQIAAAKVRLAMAERELENHIKQMELKDEELEFMKDKFTNQQLYNWMKGQVSKLYQQAFQMAHKLALAAEKAYVFEKQKENYSSFITTAYWDNLKEGLMAGDLLYHDLRRLEVEYMETNKRELELSRDIPLSMIAPEKLIALRQEGKCEFEIPEMIYDIDHPGHYMRRIKSVSISIPAVTGPYNSVTCKLSLLNNRFRNNTAIGSGYHYNGLNDNRFVHNIIGIQSIATSTGNNDTGMFEFNFKDERYLPFEGAGAVGRWGIELPYEIRKFNYDTISDVILHVKYTAIDAGGMLRQKAEDNIVEKLNYLMEKVATSEENLVIVHSLKSEFADSYYELCTNADKKGEITITKDHLPYMMTELAQRKGKTITVPAITYIPKTIRDTYQNSGMVLDDNGLTFNIFSEDDLSGKDAYVIIEYKLS